MTVESLVSDAVIWATLLLLVVGGAALVMVAVVAVMGRPGGRLSLEEARATIRRIVAVAVVVYGAAFLGGLIVGLLQ